MKTVIAVESFDELAERKKIRAGKLSRGERIQPERRISFSRVEDMLACLTPERLRVLSTVKEEPRSMSDLARSLGRNRGSVTRDVKVLHQHRLVVLKRQVNPGHGIVRMVKARSKHMQLQAAI